MRLRAAAFVAAVSPKTPARYRALRRATPDREVPQPQPVPMKAKEIFYLLGIRPKPRTYGYEIRSCVLPRDGEIRYAQWLHPNEKPKLISQEAVDELRRFLKPGDVALDIGAHSGDSALPIALALGPSGVVLALEPNPYVFPVLKKTADLNFPRMNIVPLEFAATPEDGNIEFEYSDSGFCNGGRHEGISRWKHAHAFKLKVRGRNLATVLEREYAELAPRVRYIKVDAEGYDRTVLSTLTGLIARTRPYIRAEVFKGTSGEQRAELFHLLEGCGYAVHKLESEKKYLGARLGASELTRWPHFDVFCVPV
jgi:FkbM family methyltransferase